MAKLHLYTVFHGNLNFSYVSERFYGEVINRCYEPLLDVIERTGAPLGLELSGRTLELCHGLNPSFVERLAALWHRGVCEVIGSGYVQAIFPLIPARVNQENLRRGNDVYRRLLGREPATAFINEQVFSRSLPELYREAGYRALIVNWESAARHMPDSLQHRPCRVEAGEGKTIDIIWNSTQGYRNFQNFMEDKMDERSFWEALLSHASSREDRLWPLYGSDWEVFDFTPWALPDPERVPAAFGQVARIEGLLRKIKGTPDLELILPAVAIDHFGSGPLVSVASAEHPLPFKKQDFFSVARWAVAGRSAARFNALCHRFFQELLNHEREGAVHGDELDELWSRLCLLWNSDFRTFTTEEKYWQFYRLMGEAMERMARYQKMQAWRAAANPAGVSASHESAGGPARADSRSAGQAVSRRPDGDDSPWKASPGSAIKTNGSNGSHITATPFVKIALNREAGGTLHWVEFPRVSSHPLLLSRPDLPASQGAIGSVFLRDQRGMLYEDTARADIRSWLAQNGDGPSTGVVCQSNHELGQIRRTYLLSAREPRLDIRYAFQLKDFVPSVFRLGRLVLNPAFFDEKSLYFETVNGGRQPERFALNGRPVLHDMALSANVTSRGCLGATEGWVELGDLRCNIRASVDLAHAAGVPMIHFEPGSGGPFDYSIVFSLGEQDDTSFALWRGYFEWTLSLVASEVQR